MFEGEGKKRSSIQINGMQVAEVRRNHNLTQTELAILAKPASKSWISAVERKSTINVSLAFAERLANTLGLEVKDLVRFT